MDEKTKVLAFNGNQDDNFDYMFLSDDEYNDLVESIQAEIARMRAESTENGPASIANLNVYLHGLRDLMDKTRILSKRYTAIVAAGRYYTYYFKDPKEKERGDICLILDGKTTDYIIPPETLEDLELDIKEFIYDGNGEKYPPLADIVGDRPFLPVPWFINLCVGLEPKTPKLDLSIKAPQNLIMTLDKVTQSINAGRIEYGDEMTGVNTGKGGSDDFAAGVLLSFDENIMNEFSANRELTIYDMAVFAAVCSSAAIGGEFIPIGTIYSTLAGRKKKVHDAQRDEIKGALRKLMGTIIKIDTRGEAKSYGFERVVKDGIALEGPMLGGYLIERTVKGNTVTGFRIDRIPPLFLYAQTKKQLVSVPTDLLDIPINNTKMNIALKNALLSRVLRMKRSPNMNNAINYDNLIDSISDSKASTINTEKKRRKEVTEKTRAILEHWKTLGFIEDYDEHTTGRKKDYVKIYFKQDSEQKIPAGIKKKS